MLRYKLMTKQEKVRDLLTRNVQEVVGREHLRAILLNSRKLRVKHGIDPTGEKIHIGRAVVLWKLKEFQDLGHKIILIIGDFTAQIGDPSDKLAKRPFLTSNQVKKNLKSYLDQISRVLDLKKIEVRHNSEWLSKLDFREISELAENFTIQQMLERRNFSDRMRRQEEISVRELLYPLMQGYDSVAVKADVELGGTDQLFNLLAGRKIQERYGQRPQDILVTKMLLGLDGRKMSTSWGNVINITDSPDEQYGKVMSMRDEAIPEYLELTTGLAIEEVRSLIGAMSAGGNPKEAKERVAYETVKRYHGEKAAFLAASNFSRVFSKKDLSVDLPSLLVPKKIELTDLVLKSGVAKSKAQAWRLITQGGFSLDGKVLRYPKESISLKGGEVVKIGKKSFFRVTI